MFGMKLPMPHFCFKTHHSCEKAAGTFIKANEREATLTKENIFQKIFIWKIHGSSMSCNEKFTTQGSLPWILRCILLVWKIRLLWDRAAVPVLYESRHTILLIILFYIGLAASSIHHGFEQFPDLKNSNQLGKPAEARTLLSCTHVLNGLRMG